MALRILSGGLSDPEKAAESEMNAAARIRALCLPLPSPDRAEALLPSLTLMGPSIAGRAEALVIRRLGATWPAILAGTPLPIYANGDAALALDLLYDATVLWCCALTVPLLAQFVPTLEKSEVITVQRDLSWEAMRVRYVADAQAALGLLRPVTVTPALSMTHPYATIIDPAADPDNILVPSWRGGVRQAWGDAG